MRALALFALFAIPVSTIGVGGPAPAVIFWDADFDEQLLGELPQGPNPDGPPDLPTSLRRTNATYTIVVEAGDLVSQPFEVVKVGPSAIPRVSFRLGQAAALDPVSDGSVLIELDMLGDPCDTSFGGTVCYKVLVLKAGGTQAGGIEWGADDLLRLIGALDGPAPIPYVLDVAKHIEIQVDLDAVDPLITVRVDGAVFGTAAFPAGVAFDGIALESAALSTSGRFALDNVLIESVPEPARGLLGAAGLSAVAAICKRRRLRAASWSRSSA